MSERLLGELLRIPSEPGIQLAAAMTVDGSLLLAREAERGLDYFCPACKTDVILRRGEVRRPHFAHENNNQNCTGESREHIIGKMVVIKVVNEWKREGKRAPMILRCCEKCGSEWQEPLPDDVYDAHDHEMRTDDGSRADVPLRNNLLVMVYDIEIYRSHKVSAEKAARLRVRYMELRAVDLIEDPYLWRPTQDTFPRTPCKRCQQIAAEELAKDWSAAIAEDDDREFQFNNDWNNAIRYDRYLDRMRDEAMRHRAEQEEQDRMHRIEQEERQRVWEEEKRKEQEGREARFEAAWEGLVEDQKIAVKSICNSLGGLFWLTGPAGSGKSFVINFLRREMGADVCAMTGTASQLVGGSTFHSFIGWRPFTGISEYEPNPQVLDRLRETKLLIVDEASMLSCDGFERYLTACREASHMPKTVLVGDFLQLGPIKGEYLYRHRMWSDFDVKKLTSAHRQDEPFFFNTLGETRLGSLTQNVRNLFEARRVETLPKDVLQLYPRKEQALKANEAMLSSMIANGARARDFPWQEHFWNGRMDPDDNAVAYANAVRTARCYKNLKVCPGARICMLTNDREKRWVNGSTGTLLGWESDTLRVLLDNGREVRVERQLETVRDADDEPELQVYQFPVILAWALTIHKAQGMTLDRVGVDITWAWAPGQIYTAVSRCRTMAGLFIRGRLTELRVDPEGLRISR